MINTLLNQLDYLFLPYDIIIGRMELKFGVSFSFCQILIFCLPLLTFVKTLVVLELTI